ncbi:hypothetical protein RRG08_063118 [Elysia crispata]|uniref:PiggyBac transposable element-derived protein domain-containing protein n=1 Tax=Elysia crispata TaxID=231223 RepID=A0AAE1CMT5_9GAST|nr:hypothetical protein RRG08_063118 [Elysia crispata]
MLLTKGSKGPAKKTPAYRWRATDIKPSEDLKWNEENVDNADLSNTVIELFELFFDPVVIDLICTESVRYAAFKGNHNFSVTPGELKTFIAILIVSGYCSVPRRRMYWSGDEDVRNEAIVNGMKTDRFDEIMKYFHLTDNSNLDVTDKFSKVRPLFSLMNECFQKYFQQKENLSVDESMIQYFGRHSAKQFIKGKPIRYGYKIWILTTSLGYAINLIPYQSTATVKAVPGLGMAGQVVLDLVTALPQNCFHVTFDNLFSSLALAEELTRRGLACTGTVRANRTGDCPILDTKTMEKKARGSYDFKADNEKVMIMTRWNDNNVVTLLSNKKGVEPLGTASRWSKKEGQRVAVPQPNVVKHYNSTMGGVDRLNQNVGLYRCGINSKK